MKTAKKDMERPPRNLRENGQEGVVLIVAVILIAALCFIAATTIKTVKPEIQGAGYYKNERQAFYNAEAGIQYAVDCISRDLLDHNLALTGEIVNVAYSAPAGYEFDTITELRRLNDNLSYIFTVTGRCLNARVAIEATVQRPSVLAAGIFGNNHLVLEPDSELYSYDSTVAVDPDAANSTGDANAGSNKSITVQPGVVVDGVLLLGEDEFGFGPSPISGYENEEVGQITHDPLGTTNGLLADAFSHYSDPANNDNDTTAYIVDNVLDLDPNSTITIPGGHYYLEYIYLGPNATLQLDATDDNPVVFFLSGQATIKPNAITTTGSGRPTEFFLFSNQAENMKIYPNDHFEGFVYAPYAYIELKPNVTTRGVFYGDSVVVNPNAEAFIDTSLLNAFLAPYVEVTQWRHVID